MSPKLSSYPQGISTFEAVHKLKDAICQLGQGRALQSHRLPGVQSAFNNLIPGDTEQGTTCFGASSRIIFLAALWARIVSFYS